MTQFQAATNHNNDRSRVALRLKSRSLCDGCDFGEVITLVIARRQNIPTVNGQNSQNLRESSKNSSKAFRLMITTLQPLDQFHTQPHVDDIIAAVSVSLLSASPQFK